MLQAKTYFPTVTLLPRFNKSLARYYKKHAGENIPPSRSSLPHGAHLLND